MKIEKKEYTSTFKNKLPLSRHKLKISKLLKRRKFFRHRRLAVGAIRFLKLSSVIIPVISTNLDFINK